MRSRFPGAEQRGLSAGAMIDPTSKTSQQKQQRLAGDTKGLVMSPELTTQVSASLSKSCARIPYSPRLSTLAYAVQWQ